MPEKYYINSAPYALVKYIKLKSIISSPLASLNTVAKLVTVFSQVSQTLPTSLPLVSVTKV